MIIAHLYTQLVHLWLMKIDHQKQPKYMILLTIIGLIEDKLY